MAHTTTVAATVETASREDITMTARQQKLSEEEADARAKLYARSLLDGYNAAESHAPEFLGMRALLQIAWEISWSQQNAPLPAQRDAYFVGWVRGYLRRVNETQNVLDTWEDEGGALAGA